MNNEHKIILTLALLFSATALHGQSLQLKVATVSAGAARLDNGSIITIGQPFVGMMSAPGGMVSMSSGLQPALLQEKGASGPLVITPAVSLAGGRLQFGFPTQPGRNYVVLASWTPIWTNPGTWTGLTFEDTDAGQFPHRFYQVREP